MEERVEKSYRIAYLGNNLLSIGFKIAGVTEAYTVSDTQQAESRFKSLLENEEVGIVIMTSSVRRMIRDRRLGEAITESIKPLVVEVPELNEKLEEEETLRNLIIRAIGIDITGNVK